MKKFGTVLLGVLVGVCLTLLALYLFGNSSTASDDNLTIFDEPGEVMKYSQYTVIQALDDGYALATADNDILTVVLIWDQTGVPFYDHQEVKATEGYRFRQMGIYKYETNKGLWKTVPVVSMMK